MDDEIPRRLRRFKGKKGSRAGKSGMPDSFLEQIVSEKDLKNETTHMALKEVRNFREKHKRFPKQEEFDEIAENVYNQLKGSYEKEAGERRVAKTPGEEKAGKKESFLERRRKRRTAEKEGLGEETTTPAKKTGKDAGKKVEGEAGKPGGAGGQPLIKPDEGKELSIEGLFEKEGGDGGDELSLPELAKSEEMTSLGEDLELITDDTDSVNKEMETTKNKCPSCGSKTEHIIFCPECGCGFCAHCAEKIEVLEDKIKYVCPKCGSEFKANKLAR